VYRHAALFLICCGLTSTLAGCPASGGAPTPPAQTLYDRVIAAGTLRCGYVVYHPGLYKDPNTGKISGIFADTVEEAMKNLGLKVQWVEEVGWGTMIEGLEANRYDMICSPVWANSTRARHVAFSVPLFYSGIGAYVRTDDTRFTSLKTNGTLVSAATTAIATIDGEMSDIIARTDYPAAKRVSLPQLSDVSQVLLNLTSSKADVAFVEPAIAAEFIKGNPGKIRNIAEDQPVRVFGNAFMFKRGEPAFKNMIDAAVQELLNGGFVDHKIDQYEPFTGSLYRVAYPYRAYREGTSK